MYHTYRLLHCKKEIEITSNHNKVNVETIKKKHTSKQNDKIKFNTLKNIWRIYYIVKDTFS